jgi:hypothetical protein
MIINNHASLQTPILLLKITIGTQNNFSQNYPQFGHRLPNVSPALHYGITLI